MKLNNPQHLLIEQPSTSSLPSHIHEFKWSKLWSIRGVSPRIILFIWRGIHNGLAVGKVLSRMFGGSGLCSRCQTNVETVEHSLFLCPSVIEVWNNSGLDLSWLRRSITLSSVISTWYDKDRDVFRRGVAILWALWKARNNWVFNSKVTDSEEILRATEQIYMDYYLPPEPSMFMQQPSQSMVQSYLWTLPPLNSVKINFDGACLNGEIAAAAIARDSKGSFLGCLSRANIHGSPILAEAHACILAIDLIHRLKLTQVIIEGDSIKSLMDNINGICDKVDWQIAPTVRACQRLKIARVDIKFQFSPRTTNKVAHALATHSITQRVNSFWSGGLPPPFLLDHLFSDLASAVTPSVVE